MSVHKSKEQSQSPQNIDKLNELMDQYGEMVIRLAYTYVKQKEIAEDISQEVFISCYRHLDQFEERASYKTWLYRITVNKCKDYLKSWSYRNLFSVEFSKLYTLVSSGQKENEIDLDQEIFRKVMNLSLKHREVIILHYYEDLSIQEIADLLKENPNTIKTRLHRGRNKLKQIMSEVGINR